MGKFLRWLFWKPEAAEQAPAAETGPANLFYASDADFEQALACDLPVLVNFYAPWCTVCNMFAPTFEALSQEYAGRVTFVKVNADSSPQVVSDYEVQSVPTLILFRGGEPAARVNGRPPVDDLRRMLNQAPA